jgi:hypothetical protein
MSVSVPNSIMVRASSATRSTRNTTIATYAIRVELEPREKHEHEESDLTQRIQEPETGRRKESRRDGGSIRPEQRRTECDASEHLADDLRLANPSDERAAHPSRDQDDDDLGEKQWNVRRGGAGRKRYGGNRRRAECPGRTHDQLAHAEGAEQHEGGNADECGVGR